MFGMALRRDAHDTAAAAERCDDVEIPVLVKRQALRPTQPAIEHMHFAVLRDAIDAVVAGGGRPAHVEFAAGVKREMIRGDRGFFFSSKRRHTIWNCDWSSDVCSSDLSGSPDQTSLRPPRKASRRSCR